MNGAVAISRSQEVAELTRAAPLPQRIAARMTGSPWFWSVFVLLGFTLPIVRSMNRALPASPPVLAPLPAFSLVDQQGHAFGSAQIRGQVVIAELLGRNAVAALQTGGVSPLAALQRRVRNTADAVHLVSFVEGTMDAAALSALSKTAHAGAWRWTLAAGASSEGVSELRASLERSVGSLEGRLILIDGRGRIRRVVGSSTEDIDLMMRDIGVLVNVEGNR
jgi:protein SCO1/2